MNKDIAKQAQDNAPVWGVAPWYKVALWKIGFLFFVEGMSKAGAVSWGWPIFCGLIVGSVTYFKVPVEIPMWLMLSIQALLLGMFAFKSTTKTLLSKAGDALLEWAKKR